MNGLKKVLCLSLMVTCATFSSSYAMDQKETAEPEIIGEVCISRHKHNGQRVGDQFYTDIYKGDTWGALAKRISEKFGTPGRIHHGTVPYTPTSHWADSSVIEDRWLRKNAPTFCYDFYESE